MIRATIIVSDASELEHAYHILSKIPEYNIVRIKNKIKSPLQSVTANVIFQDSIVSEIQFRFGSKPTNYYANHFLYELRRADSVAQLQQQILM